MRGTIPENGIAELKRLGNSCAEWRRSMKLTQKDIADSSGYTVQAVSAFERGLLNNGLLLAEYCRKGYEVGKG